MTRPHPYVPGGMWCRHVFEEPSETDPLGAVCGQPRTHPDHEVGFR